MASIQDIQALEQKIYDAVQIVFRLPGRVSETGSPSFPQ